MPDPLAGWPGAWPTRAAIRSNDPRQTDRESRFAHEHGDQQRRAAWRRTNTPPTGDGGLGSALEAIQGRGIR